MLPGLLWPAAGPHNQEKEEQQVGGSEPGVSWVQSAKPVERKSTHTFSNGKCQA